MSTSGYQYALCLVIAVGVLALWPGPDDTFDALSAAPRMGPDRTSVRLLVIVPTATITNRAEHIRRAYQLMYKSPTICIMADDCPLRVRLVFVVGDPNITTSSIKGDTLTVKASDIDPDQKDAVVLVSSTTTKVLKALRWAASCGDCYDYILRQGDDAHVNLLNLYDRLTNAPATNWVLGRYLKNGPVKEPWLRRSLMIRVYPPYPSGMGYVLSVDVANAIAALRMPILTFPEDAVVGIWLLGMDVIHEDTLAFHNRRDRNVKNKLYRAACKSTDILTHYMLPSDYDEINPFDFTVKC